MTGSRMSSGPKKATSSEPGVNGLSAKKRVSTSGKGRCCMEEARRYIWGKGLSPKSSKWCAHSINKNEMLRFSDGTWYRKLHGVRILEGKRDALREPWMP